MEYRYRHRKRIDFSKYTKHLLWFLIAVAVIIAIMLVGRYYNISQIPDMADIPEFRLGSNYVPVSLFAADERGIVLGDRCRQLLIPITSDQVFSIQAGITNGFYRPLTHDIFKFTLDHYDIRPVRFTIDDWDSELWYATMRLQKGLDVLDLDVRPSDGVAMAVRYNLTIYIDEPTLDERAQHVC